MMRGKWWIIGTCLGLLLCMACDSGESNSANDEQAAPMPAQEETETEFASFSLDGLPDDAVVFKLNYLGLNGSQDRYKYNSSYGFGSGFNPKSENFVKNIETKFDNIEATGFPERLLSAVAVQKDEDGNITSLFVDLNGDGKLQDKEKIEPLHNENPSGRNPLEFVTPDFISTNRKGRKVKARLLYMVHPGRDYGMWRTSCVWEGTAEHKDQEWQMVLFDSGMDFSFSDFGEDYMSIDKAGKSVQRAGSDYLSEIIGWNGSFWNVELLGGPMHPDGFFAVLTPNHSPKGNLAFQLKNGDQTQELKIGYAMVRQESSTNSRYRRSGGRIKTWKLPAGKYVANLIYLYLPKDEEGHGDSIKISNNMGSIEVKADRDNVHTLGTPKMHITIVDSNDRYSGDRKEASEFSDDTTIYMEPTISDEFGFEYGQWRGKGEQPKPHVTITDSEGKQVVSADMEYG
ncbi:MAG: hypothetical protein ACLFUS_13590 [Candidatus Sumerlaeia bacterium]